jgi:hypothetical protein
MGSLKKTPPFIGRPSLTLFNSFCFKKENAIKVLTAKKKNIQRSGGPFL